MDYPKSIPSVGLVNGKFVDENPVAGTPGSLIPSAWGNAITEEVLSVITAGGLVPAEADVSQLLKAIRAIVQAATTNYAIDTGTAGVYKAAFTPAITALTDGTVVRLKIKTANVGASTFSPDELAAKPIVGSAHVALQGGELVASGYAWLQYSSSVGGGSWVILAGSGGAQQVAEGIKSNQAVNQSQLGSMSGMLGFDASGTLDSGALGQLISVNFSHVIPTLPPVGGAKNKGRAIAFSAPQGCTIKANGTELIYDQLGAAANTLKLAPGEQIQLVTDGSSWRTGMYSKNPDQAIQGAITASRVSPVFTGSPTAPTQSGTDNSSKLATTAQVQAAILAALSGKLLGSVGYQKLPGGLIVQWGEVSVAAVAGSYQAFPLPIRFPGGCAVAIGGRKSLGSNAVMLVGQSGGDPSGQLVFQNYGASAEIGQYIAIGY